MATAGESKLKLLPNVRLHPVHRGNGSAGPPCALRALQSAGSSRACRKWEVDDLLHEAISGEMGIVNAQEKPDTHHHRISLSSTCMVVGNADEEFLSIQLLLADVVGAMLPERHGSGYAVALAPRPEAASSLQSLQEAGQGPTRSRPKSGANTSYPPLQDVWVLVVEGNSLDLKGLFLDLSGRGALRWDLHECYTIARKPIGEGGCGKIFVGQSLLARKFQGLQNKLENSEGGVQCMNQVAVKILKQHATQTEEELLRKEIDFLARARGHPNITALHGVFCSYEVSKGCEESDGQESGQGEGHIRWFIVMDLCRSGDLFDYLLGGALDNGACMVLMKGLSEALHHLHSLEIVHRDVKPENILMGANSRPILTDFGIAAKLDDAEEMAKVLGSPGFAAPELVSNEPYTELVDIFSAGVVCYYALTCRQPFHGHDRDDTLARTSQCKVRYPQKWFQHASTGILNLMKFCLSRDPRKRPSAQQCFNALRKLESESLVGDPLTETLSLAASPGAQSQAPDDQRAKVPSMPPKGSSHQERSLVAAEAADESSSAARPIVCSMASSEARCGASSLAQAFGPATHPPRSAALMPSPAVRPAIQTNARPTVDEVSPPAALPANRCTAGHEASSASSSAVPHSQCENQEPPTPSSTSFQAPPTPTSPPDSATLLNPSNLASELPMEPKCSAEINEKQEMLGEPREEKELLVRCAGPTEPAEQQKTARRPQSVPSRVKQSLLSMPSTASRWISGVFSHTSSPAVEDPSPSAPSLAALGNQPNNSTSEHTPKPPSSRAPSKRTFRSRALNSMGT